VDEQHAWRWLRSLAGRDGAAPAADPATAPQTDEGDAAFHNPAAQRLLELYLPLCRDCPERFVVAHLGQSLDGRIAAANGASRWLTGPEDLAHNHRMRALFDAVVVGAGTVEKDDPQLTVRAVPGSNPVRVVLDPRRRLAARHRIFTDGAAPTLLVCDEAAAAAGPRVGQAEVVGAASEGGRLVPRAVLDRLAARGLRRVFVEGGGITVSGFLAAGCLSRLQIAIAPLIIGSGRPSITLPEISRLSAGLRPPTRWLSLGRDILVECRFDG
jgi:diaminohydroxyphosphoribosylaminopyrimidine deaminase/5-amino-6-(5-phosphoribosylamino)uracil reductase